MSKAVRMLSIIVSVVAILGVSTAAFAAVTFTDLGTVAPPASLGPFSMAPFDTVPQAAIVNGTGVTTIPGSPVAGNLNLSASVTKQTIGSGWASWSHGYTGPVFVNSTNSVTMTLPPNSSAFYFYAEPEQFAAMTITATTDSGTTSGPISVNGNAGANGFGFFAGPGESITTITVTTNDTGFAIAEFGIAGSITAVPTMNEWGMIIFIMLAGLGAVCYLRRQREA
jgi:hypothetical protein